MLCSILFQCFEESADFSLLKWFKKLCGIGTQLIVTYTSKLIRHVVMPFLRGMAPKVGGIIIRIHCTVKLAWFSGEGYARDKFHFLTVSINGITDLPDNRFISNYCKVFSGISVMMFLNDVTRINPHHVDNNTIYWER